MPAPNREVRVPCGRFPLCGRVLPYSALFSQIGQRMLGHGCPAGPRKSFLSPSVWGKGGFAPLYSLFLLIVCTAVSAVYRSAFLCASETAGEAGRTETPTARLNFSWTSDTPEKWEGELRLEQGTFTGLAPLGSDRCASVTFYPSEDRKVISISSPAECLLS